MLDAATRGPTGGNRQAWGWVVVTDPAIKEQVAQWYREGWQRAYGPRREEVLGAAPSDTGLSPAAYRATEHLADHIQEAPVWVIPVLRNAADSQDPRLGASIYGAVQQLILAARAHGLGSTLTSFHVAHEEELRTLLGLPADALSMALIPCWATRLGAGGHNRSGNRSKPSSTGMPGATSDPANELPRVAHLTRFTRQ